MDSRPSLSFLGRDEGIAELAVEDWSGRRPD